MTERLRWGILGAAWIADRAVIPALDAATGCELVAIASRNPERAAAMARRAPVSLGTRATYVMPGWRSIPAITSSAFAICGIASARTKEAASMR